MTIGDLDSGSAAYLNIPYSLDQKITSRLELISKFSDSNGTAWSKAWRMLKKGPFNFAFSNHPRRPCSECRSVSLFILQSRHGRIMNIPIREGFKDLDDLLIALEQTTGLPDNFGKGKMIQLAAVLEQEMKDCAEHHVPEQDDADRSVPLSKKQRPSTHELEKLQQERDDLQKALKSIPVHALGLGPKTDYLMKLGWQTVGDLPENFESVIYRTPKMGRRTAERAISTRSNLVAACSGGAVERVTFANLQGVPIIPQKNSMSEISLPDWFRNTLIEAASYDDNPVTQLVVQKRVCQSGSKTTTLEEIGQMPGVSITRERVRQVEKRFLKRVRECLLDPWSWSAGCLFSDTFRMPFAALAESLSSQDTIGIQELSESIEQIWKCSKKEANLLLPMIMAIIEGTARTDGNLRRLGDLPESLLRPLRKPARDWPSWNFAAGKHLTQSLKINGVSDAEALRVALINGFNFGDEAEPIVKGLTYLSQLKSGHSPKIEDLADAIDKPVLPALDANPETYLSNITNDLVSLIDQGNFWIRSKDIFLRRSALPPEERVTTQVLADKYNVAGPNISKAQSTTLERLQGIILNKSAGYTAMLIRPDWIKFWTELENIFERFYPDQRTFQRSIMTTFDIPETVVGSAIHPIWAVLSGKISKTSIGQIATNVEKNNVTMAPVILKGFRNIH